MGRWRGLGRWGGDRGGGGAGTECVEGTGSGVGEFFGGLEDGADVLCVGGGVGADDLIDIQRWIEFSGGAGEGVDDVFELIEGVVGVLGLVVFDAIDDEFLCEEAAIGGGVVKTFAGDDEPDMVAAFEVLEECVVGEPGESGPVAAGGIVFEVGPVGEVVGHARIPIQAVLSAGFDFFFFGVAVRGAVSCW